MSTWKSVLALSAVGVLISTTALAQGSGSTDPSKPGASSAPSAAPSMGGDASKNKPSGTTADTGRPDAAKSDKTKSDAMKSDTTKSDRMQAGSADRAMGGGNREQVRAAQQALKDKGHDPGAIDGVMGAKTKMALRDYQKAERLKETGRLDAETMAKLGIEGKGKSDAMTPAASPKTRAPGDKK